MADTPLKSLFCLAKESVTGTLQCHIRLPDCGGPWLSKHLMVGDKPIAFCGAGLSKAVYVWAGVGPFVGAALTVYYTVFFPAPSYGGGGGGGNFSRISS